MVDVFVYTGPDGEGVPKDVVRVRVDPSVTSIPARAFDGHRKLTEVELSEGLVEIGIGAFTLVVPSWIAATRYRRLTSPTHSGGLMIMHSVALSVLLFVFMMALKALEEAHSLVASSPTLESRPSSP
jgi:hypothetical protein